MATIVFDFDYTLFDAYAFKRALFDRVSGFGITEALFWQTYTHTVTRDPQQYDYNVVTHAQLLHESMRHVTDAPESETIERALLSVLYDAQDFLFPHVREVLSAFNQDPAIRMVLLTKGNSVWQQEKIKYADIEKYFDEVRITFDKQQELYQIIAPHERVFFLSDALDECEQAQNVSGSVTSILKYTPHKDQQQLVPHIPVIRELTELYQYVSPFHAPVLPQYTITPSAPPLPSICIIGTGTGGSQMVKTLKGLQYAYRVSVIVNVTDNGGHSGQLRMRDPRIISLGDMRSNLCAASTNYFSTVWNQRTADGASVGNIELFEKFQEYEDMREVVKWANQKLATYAQIIPATYQSCDITAELVSGKYVIGEWDILEHATWNEVAQMMHTPESIASPEALAAIESASLIIIAPGVLHTGVVSALLPYGIKDRIQKSTAPILYIGNIMSFPGFTDHMTGADYVAVLEEYTGRPIDLMLIHRNTINTELLEHYASVGSHPIDWSSADHNMRFQDLVPDNPHQYGMLERTGSVKKWTHLLRHCPIKTKKALVEIINQYHAL